MPGDERGGSADRARERDDVTPQEATSRTSATALLEALAETLPQLVWLVRADGSVELVNGHWTAYTRLDLAATNRAGWTSVFDADDARRARALVEQVIATGTPSTFDARVRGGDARRAWFRVRFARVRDDRCVVVAEDIDERRRVEEALEESEQRLSWALRAADGGAWDWDLRTRVAWWSPEMYELWGVAPGFASDETSSLALVDPRDRQGVEDAIRRCLESDGEPRWEFRVRHPTRGERWMETHGRVLRDEHGRPVRMLGITVDVTERKHAENALRQSEAALRESTTLLRAICDTTSDFVYAKDREGRMLLANPAALAHIGKRASEVLGRTDVEFLNDEAAGRAVMENDRRVMERGEPEVIEEVVPDPSGVRRVFLSTKTPYRDLRGRIVGLLGISREITERKRVEEALRQREAQLRARAAELETILESLAEGVIVYDADGNVVRLNAMAARLIGGNEERTASRVTKPGAPIALLSEDGRPMAVEEMPFFRALHGETSSGAVVGFPHVGAEPTWVTVNAAPLVDGGGKVTGAVVTIVDTTDRKRAEEALRDADRRKGEFLGVLSHELRNPLAPIRNSLYVLERAPDGSDQARRAKAVIDRQVRHMSRLVDDLLDVTRISRGKIQLHRERLDLGDVVRRTVDDHRLDFEHARIALDVAIDARPTWVEGDATRLAQIVGNLLQNAQKFTEPGGAVRIRVGPRDGAAVIDVVDTGLGIDAALLPSIFEPFMQDDRTLARSRGGLGLGLALVKGLIELHGGSVVAKSDGTGTGSEFTVTLPLLRDPARDAEGDAADPRRARRRVLIIEDNVDAAESLREALLFEAHEVEVAHDGKDGLAKLHAFRPEVVLCDIGLPGMDGYDVARAVRADPSVRGTFLVALSGYALPEDVRRAKEAGFDRHLAKPPDLDDLERLLSTASPAPA